MGDTNNASKMSLLGKDGSVWNVGNLAVFLALQTTLRRVAGLQVVPRVRTRHPW